MNLFNKITNVFSPQIENEILNEDKFSSYEISYYISNFKNFSFSDLQDIISYIPENEVFVIGLKIGNSDSIKLEINNFLEFQETVIEERTIHEDESVQFTFQIKKNTEKYIYIYNFDSFCNLWNKYPMVNILHLIKDFQNKHGKLNFILLEDNVMSFATSKISFTHTPLIEETRLNKNFISDNCHFGNTEEYPFDAYSFQLINKSEVINPITEALEKYTLLFSIISLFDITTISDDLLTYKLNGYKSFNGKIRLYDLDKKLASLYFKIFDWVYCEKSNISDKIGLARNIISLSLTENSLNISDSVYLSIQSSYKAYLQANISKYIEIRNKIVDELSWISQKSGEIASNYLSNYQKSIFTFLSFFISVFILRFLKEEVSNNGFSKAETIFSLSFLLLSFLFLIFSIWNLKLEITRLIRKYNNLKSRYTDLLDVNDIERILKGDAEFNYEISYINKRKRSYTFLWITTIFVLIATVLSVSEYLNWCMILEFIIEKIK
jgi:hypothetical protein